MAQREPNWPELNGGLREDWQVVERALPEGWEHQARKLGAFSRRRGIESASTLLRLLLIHLSDGCSLRQTAVRAKEGGLAHVSDVALLNRLRRCGDWFRWMVAQLTGSLGVETPSPLPGRRLRLVDGSIVCEPGASGSTWRLHYAIDLSSLRCDEVHVTSVREGETLTRFEVQRGDLLMADRGFAHRRGIGFVVAQGGDVLTRLNLDNVPLEDETGRRLEILPRLRQLAHGQTGSWQAWMRNEQQVIPVRLCAIRKSEEQTRRAQDKLCKEAKKKKRTLKPETLEAAGYVIVLTTLRELPAETVLELYRCRWQVELAFKRLKSLLQLGHLKKTDPQGAQAWLQGKLLVAVLIERLILIGEHFSPWGYLSDAAVKAPETLLLARGRDDALPAWVRSQSQTLPTGEFAELGADLQDVARAPSKASLSARAP